MKDSLKKLLKEFPVFLNKEEGSNFYKHSDVVNKRYQGIYQNLYNIYQQLHLAKQVEIWKEQIIENRYTMCFSVNLKNIKTVTLFKNDNEIYSREYTFEEEMDSFYYSMDFESLNSVPDDTFVLSVETYDEYSYIKGFPENDTLENNYFDHNLDLDLIGDYFNLPRKKYNEVEPDLLYKTEPPFNDYLTEDDHHYLNRIKTYISHLHNTALPVLEFWKHYGLWGELQSRKNLVARMNEDETCCEGGTADCKYMSTENINENVYDFYYDLTGIPSNLFATDTVDSMKLLQRAMPLTKKLIVQANFENENMNENICVRESVSAGEYYVDSIITARDMNTNTCTVVDDEIIGQGRFSINNVNLTDVDYITVNSSHTDTVIINGDYYNTQKIPILPEYGNMGNIECIQEYGEFYCIKLWKQKPYILSPPGTRNIRPIQKIYGHQFNQSVNNLVIDGEDLKITVSGVRGSATTQNNQQIYQTVSNNSENLVSFEVSESTDNILISGDVELNNNQCHLNGEMSVYDSVNSLNVNSDTEYTFSFYNTTDDESEVQAEIRWYDDNKMLINRETKTHYVTSETESRPFITSTSPINAEYCSFIITSTTNTEIYDLMFNTGKLRKYVEGYGEGITVTDLAGCTKLRVKDSKEVTEGATITYKVYTSNDETNWDVITCLDESQMIYDISRLKKYIRIKPYFYKPTTTGVAVLHHISLEAW